MHRKKLRLRDWLVQKINEGKYGLRWVGDPKERTFRVPWKHGSRHGWSVDDAALFQAWALYTGKYKEGRDDPDPRKWKTNFRCALNALPDIKEIRGKSCPRGKDAFKIYRMTRPFRGRDHHPPSLPVGQAAEIRRRDPFQATRPFKESTFPVTMPYLPAPYPPIEPRYDTWQPRERRNSMGLTDDEIVNLVHEMMSEASSSPGLSTPGGSADSPYYGMNPFFP
ncbi:interferon regulatory factor 4-like [Orbicella faveolata]|uniref:interferon regulatory factor 4-like n=1 Tax=Orbicella faveolata TaxID=48498 RepID=UPI0009E2B1BD|nr:interferon regulatory factor 4-like [Orbicella faveolata]